MPRYRLFEMLDKGKHYYIEHDDGVAADEASIFAIIY
jgi:hypothetical protein